MSTSQPAKIDSIKINKNYLSKIYTFISIYHNLLSGTGPSHFSSETRRKEIKYKIYIQLSFEKKENIRYWFKNNVF